MRIPHFDQILAVDYTQDFMVIFIGGLSSAIEKVDCYKLFTKVFFSYVKCTK